MSTESVLGYEVFVSDPVPMDLPGLLPNGEAHMFQPLSTTLIYGQHDAVLDRGAAHRRPGQGGE